MRKRSPVVYIIVGFGVLLAVLSIVASSRRAVNDATGTSSVATFAPYVSTTSTPGAAAATAATAKGRTTLTTPIAVPTSTGRTTAPPVAPTAPKGIGSVRVSALPSEARDTLRLIDAGGPFPYGQDGVVFENRERHLPGKPTGYYHEYTVVTPGSADRGARRIIVGGGGERYYTDDHYGTFRLVVA